MLTSVALLAAGCGARIDPPITTSAAPADPSLAPAAPTAASPDAEAGGPAVGPVAAPSAAATSEDASLGATAPSNVAASGGAGQPATPSRAAAPTVGNAAAGGGPAVSRPNAPASGSRTPTAPAAPGPANGARPAGGRNSQGVTETEIKVGVLAPLSGAAGFLGELELDAVKAYLSDVNARGGVQGRKYRIVTADTRFEPPTEAVAARRLVEEEKVFALFSLLADTTAPYVATKGVPTIVFGGNPPPFSSKYPTVYPLAWNVVDTNTTFAYILTQVLKQPIKSVALTYETTNVPWGSWAKYAEKAWEAMGVEVKSVDRFNLSDGDCTQLALRIRNLGIDYWQFAQTLGWPLCQQAMSRQNFTPKFGRGGPMTDDINFVGQVGRGADGLYAITDGVQTSKNKGEPWGFDGHERAPEVDRFINSMRRFSPKSANDAGLEGIWAQTFWAAAKLLDDGLQQQAGAITWEGFNRWAQSQRHWNSGLIAPVNLDPKCKTGSQALWIYQYKWTGSGATESDWRPYGGFQKVPAEIKNKIVPGAGDCYLTAMADAEL
ncbi:MAG TPA: ABC transporter substrate-binding protein [Acidimicrobiia bacterium]|nr:ABC transporter substrate-binding protein [Acidimicrobiia bacterium]